MPFVGAASGEHLMTNRNEIAGTATLLDLAPSTVTGPSVERLERLFAEWLEDESGYDEETLPELMEAVDRDRSSDRNRFGPDHPPR